MPPVLLCIVVGAEGYGVLQVWSDVFCGLSRKGWKIVVAVLDSAYVSKWQTTFPDVRVVSAPKPADIVAIGTGRWSKLASMARRARAQLQHVDWLVDLVRTSGATTLMIQSPPESLLAAIVGRRTRLRTLWLVPNIVGSGVPFSINRRIYQMIFRWGMVVPVSNSRYTDGSFGQGSFERHVVHLGVDTDRFAPGGDPYPTREALGIPTHAPVVGLFARMTPAKGQDRLVEAIALAGTPFHVLLCGGPLESTYAIRLRERIEALGLSSRVHLTGAQADLRPYYAACDLIANLRVDPEPFGLTVIEAMASGKPVLAHRLGGPSEIISDGSTGWLIPDVEVRTIAAALRVCFERRGDWTKFGEAGRLVVERDFGVNIFASKIDNIAGRGSFADDYLKQLEKRGAA